MYSLPVDYKKLSWTEKKAVREQYITLQNGKCYYCNNKLTEDPPQPILNKGIDLSLFPPNMLKHSIHLQHNHKTGMTEGAVHAYCNCVMWQYEGK